MTRLVPVLRSRIERKIFENNLTWGSLPLTNTPVRVTFGYDLGGGGPWETATYRSCSAATACPLARLEHTHTPATQAEPLSVSCPLGTRAHGVRLPAMSASVPVSRTRPHAASPSPPRPSVEESITRARAKLEADRIAVLSKKQRKLEALQKALEAPDAPAVKDKWGRTIESGEPSRGSAQPASDADLNSTLSPSKGEPKKFGNPFATDIASKAKPMAVILAEYQREVSELEEPERLKQLEESWFVRCHWTRPLRRAVLLALAPTTPSVHALLAAAGLPFTTMHVYGAGVPHSERGHAGEERQPVA